MNKKRILALTTVSLATICLFACNPSISDTDIEHTDTKQDLQDSLVSEVPDSSLMPSFGVIIRGLYYPADKNPDNWANAYTARCNLSIDGTTEEMSERADKVAAKYNFDVVYSRIEKDFKDGKEVYKTIPVSHDELNKEYIDCAYLKCLDDPNVHNDVQIYRSSRLTGDYSKGYIRISGDPGISLPIYYDYSGRYMLYTYRNFNDCMRDFMEPCFTKITLRVNEDGQTNEFSSTESEIITEYLDAFHALYATMLEDDTANFDESCSVLDIVFTSSEGVDYVYSFDENDILYHDSKAYSLTDEDALIEANIKMLGIEEEATASLGEISYKQPADEDIKIADDGISYVKNQLLISGNPDSKYEDVSSLCDIYDFDIVGYIELTKDYQIEFRKDKTYDELNSLTDEFTNMDFVSYCSLNTVVSVSVEE